MKVFWIAAALFVAAYFVTSSIRLSGTPHKAMADVPNELLGRAIDESGNNPRMLDDLLKKGADPNSKVPNRCSPEADIYWNIEARNLMPALLYALRLERVDVAKKLLEKGANWRNMDRVRGESLYYACRTYLPLLKELVESGQDPNTVLGSVHKTTVLHEMVRTRTRYPGIGMGPWMGSPEEFKAREKRIEQQTKAIRQEYVDCASWLIDKGAKTDAIDEDGETPMHIAARNPNGASSIGVLISHKANLNIVNKKGQTPLDVAVLALNKDAVRILRKAGARMTKEKSTDQIGDIVSLLKKYGAQDVK